MSKKNTFIEDITHEVHLNKKINVFKNKIFLLGFFVPFLSSTILFLMMIAGVKKPPSLVNWVMFIIFIPLITTSLVIHQKKQLVGAYGETILILIPTFVWLLAGHVPSMKALLMISFGIIFIGFITYLIGALRKTKDTEHSKKITQILLRLGFVAASVVSTVVISIVLLNWADYSAHLAPIDEISKTNDYTSTSWILFISIVTILDAMLLVVLGLISVSAVKRNKQKKNKQKKNKKSNTQDFLTKTIIWNNKIPWYKKIFRR